jgi:hypothetical protein
MNNIWSPMAYGGGVVTRGQGITKCCVWGGRSFGLHTSKVRAKDRGHTYSYTVHTWGASRGL